MSTWVKAEIVNVVVLAAVLQADLGYARKVTLWRLVRPVIIAAALIPIFVAPLSGHGSSLGVELAGVAAGIVLGGLALVLIQVRRRPGDEHAVTAASWPYALFWVVVIGARAVFSYGADHLFEQQLAQWLQANRVTIDAVTDGLILMAVFLILTRTGGLALRARWAHPAVAGGVPAAAVDGRDPS